MRSRGSWEEDSKPLGASQFSLGQKGVDVSLRDGLFHVDNMLQLVQKPPVDLCQVMDFID